MNTAAQPSKNFLYKIPLLGRLIELLCPSSQNAALIEAILRCSDNAALPRVQNAGEIEGGAVVMHNGIKLHLSSLSRFSRQVAQANKGVLEPQHERAFAEVLQTLGNSPLILDVGAREGYFGLWLKAARPGARCVIVEPNAHHLKQTQKNFLLNKIQGQFVRAYVGMHNGRIVEDTEVITIEELSRRIKTDYVAILTADIEGYELELLKGAAALMKDRMIDYIFLSTHTPSLHQDCREFLKLQKYTLIADIPLENSTDTDGLLVARRKELKGIDTLPLSGSHHE